jgi:hypothetical protein
MVIVYGYMYMAEQLIGERGRRSGESVKKGYNVIVALGHGAFLAEDE